MGASPNARGALSAHDREGDYADLHTSEESPRIMARRRGRRARRSAPSRIFQRAAPPNQWIQRRAADATLRLPSHSFVAGRRNAAPEVNRNANTNASTRTLRHLSRLASGQLVAEASRTRSHARKPHCPLAPSHRFRRHRSSPHYGQKPNGLANTIRPARAGRDMVAAAALGPDGISQCGRACKSGKLRCGRGGSRPGDGISQCGQARKGGT